MIWIDDNVLIKDALTVQVSVNMALKNETTSVTRFNGMVRCKTHD